MISVEVKGAEEVERRLRRLPDDGRSAMEKGLRAGSILLRRNIVNHLSSRMRGPSGFWGPGSVAGSFLGARTGQTRARISPGGIVFHRGNDMYTAVGSPDPHVLQHEEGGTVRGSQFLRVPTAAALTAGGVDRYTGMSVRGIPGLRVIRTGSGKLWIVREENRKTTFLYLLVRSIRFRSRGMFKAAMAETAPDFIGGMQAQVSTMVRRANGTA